MYALPIDFPDLTVAVWARQSQKTITGVVPFQKGIHLCTSFTSKMYFILVS